MFTTKEIIRMLFMVSLLITGNVLQTYSQKSPMDVYEDDMQEEYRLHNIAGITRHILNHKEIGKSEFVLDGKLYKLKVKNSGMSGGYIQGSSTRENNWVEGESLQFRVKHCGREYLYTLKGNTLQLWSDNLSFIAYFDFNKEEISIRKIRNMYDTVEPKMYAYDYTFAGNFEKVQDWIVRNADGRANSMGKQYGKNRTFTDN